MTSRSIGDILGTTIGVMPARASRPVRRDSYHANDPRVLALWKPIGSNKQEARQIVAVRLRAAEIYDRQHKLKGKQNGPLGHIGLEVLRELYRLVDYRTGRLDPSINTVAERTSRSRAAVVKAMERLRNHSFLVRVRRTEPLDRSGAGPQVRQITNAYGLSLPPCVAATIAQKSNKNLVPDCERSRREVDQADVEAMLTRASTEQLLCYTVGNDNQPLLESLRA